MKYKYGFSYKDEVEASRIASIKEIEYGFTFFTLIERLRETVHEDLLKKAIVSNEEVKKDFRFFLGMMEALGIILDAPEEAKRILDKSNEKVKRLI